jgi:hypothetical protein
MIHYRDVAVLLQRNPGAASGFVGQSKVPRSD